MFLHVIKKHLKVSFRERSLVFWSLLFPLILATLFTFAFGNLGDFTGPNAIKVGIVESDDFKDENFKNMLVVLSEGDEPILDIYYLELDRAQLNLDENNISAYIVLDQEIELFVNKNGYNQTIVKHILDNYLQISATFENLFTINPKKASELLMVGIDLNTNYVESEADDVNIMVISYYSLIAMASLFAAFLGLRSINELEANLSSKGMRNALAPFSKMKILLPAIFIDFLIQALCVAILISYMMLLKVHFSGPIIYIYLVGIIGALIGVLIGVLVGSISKLNENAKSSILIATTFALAFFSGMVSVQVKHLIHSNLGFVAKLNPANLITDALYSLYYYETMDRYYNNIILMLIMAVVLILLTGLLMRRRQYDSI